MKKLDPILFFAKKALKNREVPVNTDDLWEKIAAHPELPQRSKSKKRPLLWLMLLSLLGVGLCWYFSPTNTDILKENNGTFKTINATDIPSSLPVMEKQNLIEEKAKEEAEKATEVQAFSIDQNQNLNSTASLNSSTAKQSVEKSNNTLQNPNPNNKEQDSPNFVPSQINEQSQGQTLTIEAPQTELLALNTDKRESINRLPNYLNPITYSPKPFIQNDFFVENLLNQEFSKETGDMVSKTKPKTKKWEETPFFVGLSVRPSFPFRSLSANVGGQNDYLNERKESETQLEAYAIDLGFGLLFKPANSPFSFSVETGISLLRINERFSFDGMYTRIDSIEAITQIYINEAGMQYAQDTGMVAIETTINQRFEHFNKYQLINIPLLVGVQYKIGEKTDLFFKGGVQFNIGFEQEGRFLAPTGNVEFFDDFEKTSEPIFNSNLGLSIMGNIGLIRKISPNLQLTLQPSVQYFPKSFTQSSFPISQKYLLLGAEVGLRWTFSK